MERVVFRISKQLIRKIEFFLLFNGGCLVLG